MAKTRYIIDIDHHASTAALTRINQLLDFAANEYAVTSLTRTEVSPDSLVLDADALERLKKKRDAFEDCAQRDTHEWQVADQAEYALGYHVLEWVLNGAPNE